MEYNLDSLASGEGNLFEDDPPKTGQQGLHQGTEGRQTFIDKAPMQNKDGEEGDGDSRDVTTGLDTKKDSSGQYDSSEILWQSARNSQTASSFIDANIRSLTGLDFLQPPIDLGTTAQPSGSNTTADVLPTPDLSSSNRLKRCITWSNLPGLHNKWDDSESANLLDDESDDENSFQDANFADRFKSFDSGFKYTDHPFPDHSDSESSSTGIQFGSSETDSLTPSSPPMESKVSLVGILMSSSTGDNKQEPPAPSRNSDPATDDPTPAPEKPPEIRKRKNLHVTWAPAPIVHRFDPFEHQRYEELEDYHYLNGGRYNGESSIGSFENWVRSRIFGAEQNGENFDSDSDYTTSSSDMDYDSPLPVEVPTFTGFDLDLPSAVLEDTEQKKPEERKEESNLVTPGDLIDIQADSCGIAESLKLEQKQTAGKAAPAQEKACHLPDHSDELEIPVPDLINEDTSSDSSDDSPHVDAQVEALIQANAENTLAVIGGDDREPLVPQEYDVPIPDRIFRLPSQHIIVRDEETICFNCTSLLCLRHCNRPSWLPKINWKTFCYTFGEWFCAPCSCWRPPFGPAMYGVSDAEEVMAMGSAYYTDHFETPALVSVKSIDESWVNFTPAQQQQQEKDSLKPADSSNDGEADVSSNEANLLDDLDRERDPGPSQVQSDDEALMAPTKTVSISDDVSESTQPDTEACSGSWKKSLKRRFSNMRMHMQHHLHRKVAPTTGSTSSSDQQSSVQGILHSRSSSATTKSASSSSSIDTILEDQPPELTELSKRKVTFRSREEVFTVPAREPKPETTKTYALVPGMDGPILVRHIRLAHPAERQSQPPSQDQKSSDEGVRPPNRTANMLDRHVALATIPEESSGSESEAAKSGSETSSSWRDTYSSGLSSSHLTLEQRKAKLKSDVRRLLQRRTTPRDNLGRKDQKLTPQGVRDPWQDVPSTSTRDPYLMWGEDHMRGLQHPQNWDDDHLKLKSGVSRYFETHGSHLDKPGPSSGPGRPLGTAQTIGGEKPLASTPVTVARKREPKKQPIKAAARKAPEQEPQKQDQPKPMLRIRVLPKREETDGVDFSSSDESLPCASKDIAADVVVHKAASDGSISPDPDERFAAFCREIDEIMLNDPIKNIVPHRACSEDLHTISMRLSPAPSTEIEAPVTPGEDEPSTSLPSPAPAIELSSEQDGEIEVVSTEPAEDTSESPKDALPVEDPTPPESDEHLPGADNTEK